MARGGALGEEPIAHALHLSADKKLTRNTRNWRHIRKLNLIPQPPERNLSSLCATRRIDHISETFSWDKVKDQVTPFGDVTMYDADGNVITK
jgi:hypothetical protein